MSLKPASGFVKLPNRERLPIIGVGDICVNKNEDVLLTLKDVKYVPGLDASYICEYNLMRNGLEVTPSLERTEISMKNGQIVATTDRINRLLVYTRFKRPQSQLNAISSAEDGCLNESCTQTKLERTVRLWHERMGHLNFGDLVRLFRRIGIKGKLICILGKAHSKPFGRSKIKSKRVLELIHSDISGKILIANQNQYAYFMLFIDDYSRFTTVYLLKEKSEVYKYFRQYKLMVENKFTK